jgi:HSP20 family protein
LFRATFLVRFFSDVDQLWSLQPADAQKSRHAFWQPSCDVKDNGDSFSIHAELPGVKKENIELDLSSCVLTITGKKESHSETEIKDDKGAWVRRERSFGSFQRRFTLPDGIEEKDVHAAFHDGVLEININKHKPEQPKRAKITVK